MKPQKLPDILKQLWQQGFFASEQTFDCIMKKLGTLGSNPKVPALSMALSRVKYLTRRGKSGQYRYIQKHAATGITAQADVLPDHLMKKLAKDFKTEIVDLRHNFGISGTCTAFMLRKILEKLIFLAFAKNGQDAKLRQPDGSLFGLSKMLSLATSSTVNGKPFLMHKTTQEIQGIKFLGDTAAHNPLTNVEMKTIQPLMPYIVIAYAELAAKL